MDGTHYEGGNTRTASAQMLHICCEGFGMSLSSCTQGGTGVQHRCVLDGGSVRCRCTVCGAAP